MLIHNGLSIFGNTDYQKFIILSRSRTGSNLLKSLMNSHPNIYTRGELLFYIFGKSHKDQLKEVFSKQPKKIKAAGFKIFYYHPHPSSYDAEVVWSDLRSMKDLKVIHLKRRNILRTVLSRKIAGNQNVWKTKKVKNIAHEQKSVNFSKQELEKLFNETRGWETKYAKVFEDHEIIDVYYEDLIADPEREIKRICKLLGVPAIPPRTELKKQNPEKASQLIRNYKKLKAEFKDTEWKSFFDE